MTANKTPKYDIIECIVAGHAPYGLMIESTLGERGYIDSGDISDAPLEPEDWPAVGQVVTGVALSYLRDGRLVVSSRPSDVAFVRSAADSQAAMEVWARLRRADEEYTKANDSLVTSADAMAVLRWALSRSGLSSEPGVALRALASAPSGLLLEVMGEVVGLIIAGSHGDEARRAIAAAGPRASAPVLSRIVDALLAEPGLNVREYSRLVEALGELGAERPLKKVIDTMRQSDDQGIRAAGELFQAPLKRTLRCGAFPEPGACNGFAVDWDGYRLVLDLGYAKFPRLLEPVHDLDT